MFGIIFLFALCYCCGAAAQIRSAYTSMTLIFLHSLPQATSIAILPCRILQESKESQIPEGKFAATALRVKGVSVPLSFRLVSVVALWFTAAGIARKHTGSPNISSIASLRLTEHHGVRNHRLPQEMSAAFVWNQ